MNMTENAMLTPVTLHNPSSCTCGRIIWLSMHCDFFAMKMGQDDGETHVEARIGSVYRETAFHPENLKETVNDFFWEMWAAWQPAEGIKVMHQN